VEEVVIEDDPEYHLIDSFRSSTKSNEQRQLLLFELSGKTRRLIGMKAEEAGGDSVFGYQEYFDLEEENIVVRGLGTICRIEDKEKEHELMIEPLITEPFKSKLRNEVILCTLTEFEQFTIRHIGCVVSARSVKLISPMKKQAMAKQRDSWWIELREEIKSHARALDCTHVIGYKETMEVQKDMCILSAVGTSAIVKSTPHKKKACRICHVPYNTQDSPFHSEVLKKCRCCKKKDVPEVLITTIEPPKEFQCNRSTLIEARVCRHKKNKVGEANAKQVSDILPFVEKDLNKQLLYKMKVQGMNAAFKLSYTISVGVSYVICTATATCTLSSALPAPQTLEFVRSLQVKDEEDEQMVKTQEAIEKYSEFNRDVNEILENDSPDEKTVEEKETQPNTPREEQKSFIFEIDDDTDEDNMAALLDPIPPDGISFCNLKSDTLLDDLKIISNLHRVVIRKEYQIRSNDKLNQYLSSVYNDIYASIAFNLNEFAPCAIWGLESDVNFRSEQVIEISVSMMALMVKVEVDEEA
jgi:hypothetical protein